jgi:hypothetical protein
LMPNFARRTLFVAATTGAAAPDRTLLMDRPQPL